MATQKPYVNCVTLADAVLNARAAVAPTAPVSVGADAFYTGPTPAELHHVYSCGFQGIRPGTVAPEVRRGYADFMATQPRLYDIFPWAKGLGKGKANLPFLAAMQLEPDFGVQDAQEEGSCVTHGVKNAAMIDYSLDSLYGETTYKGRLCAENIYRSRGSNGDGWYCAAGCDYVGPNGKGGFLHRKLYENGGEKVDLTKYNGNWASNGSRGVPGWLEAESARNKAKWIIPIGGMEEYRDALAIGFGINVCSGQGFTDTTDEFGVADAKGAWSHAMAHVGCIDTEWANKKYGGLLGNICQSWGKWNTQRGVPEGTPKMPKGSFYGRGGVVNRMLSGGDSFALCSVWGWERTGWEAFDTTTLLEHLRNSTVQDYYKDRAECGATAVEQLLDERSFASYEEPE